MEKINELTTPDVPPRPEWETKWAKMTPQQKILHHRRAVRDRNEELEILFYAIYTRMIFTVISFLVCIIFIPFFWINIKKEK